MFCRIYLEDLAAGAFLHKISGGRKILTYNELEDFGRRVVARLKNEGHDAEMRLSRELTNKMYENYGDFFRETLFGKSFGVELVDGKTADDLLDKFIGVLAFPVMEAMYIEPLASKEGRRLKKEGAI